MALSSLFKKAADFLGLTSPDDSEYPPPLDGEIIFCKNNVCVHPPASLSHEIEHYPGYLYLRPQDDEILGTTLILSWIPNTHLKKNPRSVEHSPAHPRFSPRRSPRQEYSKSDWNPSASPIENEDASSNIRKCSADQTSLSSHSSCDVIAGTEENVYQSQYDSGLGSEAISHEGEEAECLKNNIQHSTSACKKAQIGQNVNCLDKLTNEHAQCFNAASDGNISLSCSSSSGDTSTTAQLEYLLQSKCNTESKHCSSEPSTSSQTTTRSSKRSSGSNKSVTSIEMDGDKLVIVTEESFDSPFTDDVSGSEGNAPVEDELFHSAASSDSISAGSPADEHYRQMLLEIQEDRQKKRSLQPDCNLQAFSDRDKMEKLKETLDLQLDLHHTKPVRSEPNIKVEEAALSPSNSSTTTSGPDSDTNSPMSDVSLESPGSNFEATHNMMFPDNSVTYSKFVNDESGSLSPKSARENLCGVFSVDLGMMRSLRIFYNDDSCTNGHLIIASRESQYKILHFHHGGLDKLSETFAEWRFLAQPRNKDKSKQLNFRQFSVIRPYFPNKHQHPEEGAYEMVNEETWHHHMNELGQIEDDFHLRKAIFFDGLKPCLRHEMWPFLLQYYPYSSTFEEREEIRNVRYIQYQNIRKQREAMPEAEKEDFWKNVQCTVEKDVIRTDRSHPYYEGSDNPNIDVLKSILLNYAVAHPSYGYTQGMSDLLAPVLAEVQNEVDAYWCFEGLMEKTIFVSSPRDSDMDKQLNYLRELLRLMTPKFHRHLSKVDASMDLLFCHRWILLCFKREFSEGDALKMWEACWAHYQTDYFHIFICVAIIAVYGEDVVQQNLPADEMLLYFSSLSMHMNGNVVLKKARALLHRFRTRPHIPCTLVGLCSLCEPGMWDSGHVPKVVCTGHHVNEEGEAGCPYGGKTDTVACVNK